MLLKTQQSFVDIVPELNDVEEYIEEMFNSHMGSMSFARSLYLGEKGKKLRPALFLTGARMHMKDLQPVIPIAVSMELIHTATLVHDDVIDNARRRRNRDTINISWGEKMAVLLGDYLFARAFTLLTSYAGMEIIDLMANVVEEISVGEIQQQIEAFNADLSEEEYLEKIKQKTAIFIASCCLAGCLTAEAPTGLKSACYNYGLNLGMAFQIIDDTLDFNGSKKTTGKDSCSDIRNGIITLPLIHTLRYSSRKDDIYSAIKGRGLDESVINFIVDEVRAAGGLDYSVGVAESYIDKAISYLEDVSSQNVARDFSVISQLVLQRAF